MMKMDTGEGFPLRQGAETGLDWFSVATESSGGGTPDLGFFLELSVNISGFGVENKSGESSGCPRGREARPGGWARPHPHGQLGTLLAQLFYFEGFFCSIKNHKKLARQLDSVWYSFSIKLKNKEKTEIGTGL